MGLKKQKIIPRSPLLPGQDCLFILMLLSKSTGKFSWTFLFCISLICLSSSFVKFTVLFKFELVSIFLKFFPCYFSFISCKSIEEKTPHNLYYWNELYKKEIFTVFPFLGVKWTCDMNEWKKIDTDYVKLYIGQFKNWIPVW